MGELRSFRVPFAAAESEFTEKRSRFIGHIWPVETEEQAQAYIRAMKKRYYDARHNCWCYLVGESIVVQRGDKLVGLVHPDYDEAKLLGLNNEDLKGVMEQNRQQLNQVVPAYSKVAEFEILEEEFEKTPKKSIKRYLYK